LSGFSPWTSQRTIMLVLPVHTTRLLTSMISPTQMGLRKSIGSVEAVTTTLRQKRAQATAAFTSISGRARPPNKEPSGLASFGKTVSTVTTHSEMFSLSFASSCRALAIERVYETAVLSAHYDS